jgi:hypothetical protein
VGGLLGADRLERTWEGALGGLDQPIFIAADEITSAQENARAIASTTAANE